MNRDIFDEWMVTIDSNGMSVEAVLSVKSKRKKASFWGIDVRASDGRFSMTDNWQPTSRWASDVRMLNRSAARNILKNYWPK